MTHEHGPHNDNQQQSKAKWVFIGFLIIAGYLLVTEHRAHLSGWLSSYWIYLLLLACPLMHLFMHHDHGGHGERPSQKDNRGEQK
jgi:SNF family Na+-dependent transporter